MRRERQHAGAMTQRIYKKEQPTFWLHSASAPSQLSKQAQLADSGSVVYALLLVRHSATPVTRSPAGMNDSEDPKHFALRSIRNDEGEPGYDSTTKLQFFWQSWVLGTSHGRSGSSSYRSLDGRVEAMTTPFEFTLIMLRASIEFCPSERVKLDSHHGRLRRRSRP